MKTLDIEAVENGRRKIDLIRVPKGIGKDIRKAHTILEQRVHKLEKSLREINDAFGHYAINKGEATLSQYIEAILRG